MKNNADALFFTPEVCAAERPKPPVIASEKTPPRISPRGAALTSGMVGKSIDPGGDPISGDFEPEQAAPESPEPETNDDTRQAADN